MVRYSLSLLVMFVTIITIPVDVIDADVHPTELVERICKKTSEYTLCVDSLYSDQRTPQADQFTIAYISVGLAYNHAVSTRDFISKQLLLRKNNNNATDQLRGCAADYDSAVSKMAMASKDLDSETYFELQSLSHKASLSARHCQKVFPSSPTLSIKNHHFTVLCQIVGAVGELFTGGTIS